LSDIDSLWGIYVSFDYGLSWKKINEGFNPNGCFISLYINSNIIYGGLDNIWTRRLSEIIAIEPISTVIPRQYYLSQNYPNPFNPTTKIKFDIAQHTRYSLLGGDRVSLKVYDIMGRELATLVNEQLLPGTYSVDWNASAFPSGIYFYKIISGDYTETKRMIFIK
jgi:hypothetical protein